MTADRISEAQAFLRALGFDAERRNERSALVFLALANLTPNAPWKDAEAPAFRVLEVMEFISRNYGQTYAPNTRETIRRRTLHQFVEAGLVEQNPDDPLRAINSPKNCYRLSPRALDLARKYGASSWEEALGPYLADLPGLQAIYANAREQNLIPATLPDGSVVELTPGGQNELLRLMLEEFCPRWTPGGHVLYVGDAGREDPVFDVDRLAALGIEVDKHGKLPDLVVYLPEKAWLVLMEAASSHGPVDAKRHAELQEVFASSRVPLVFVSCFPSRAELRKYLVEIAWETEVWCADNPSHLIHFNGERFLGPYE